MVVMGSCTQFNGTGMFPKRIPYLYTYLCDSYGCIYKLVQ